MSENSLQELKIKTEYWKEPMIAMTFGDIGAEINRYFDPFDDPPSGNPTAVILTGGVAVGKTTIRKEKYSEGYVLIDAAQVFHNLCGENASLAFPDDLKEILEYVGNQVTRRALAERRNIVTEIIGADLEPTTSLMDWLIALGYEVHVEHIVGDPMESWERNVIRGDNVSAYYAEPIHRKWIIDACSELIPVRDCFGREAVETAMKSLKRRKNEMASLSGKEDKKENLMAQPLRAPLIRILPSMIPNVLETGVPGYLAAPTIVEGERKLSEEEIRPVLAAATYLCAFNYALDKGFDGPHVLKIFDTSLLIIDALSPTEKVRTGVLAHAYCTFFGTLSSDIIRENHPLDDWICESWWRHYQQVPYSYPSQMSNAIAHALDSKTILDRCVLEDSEELEK